MSPTWAMQTSKAIKSQPSISPSLSVTYLLWQSWELAAIVCPRIVHLDWTYAWMSTYYTRVYKFKHSLPCQNASSINLTPESQGRSVSMLVSQKDLSRVELLDTHDITVLARALWSCMPVFTAMTLKVHLKSKLVICQGLETDEVAWAHINFMSNSPCNCRRKCQSSNLQHRVDTNVIAISWTRILHVRVRPPFEPDCFVMLAGTSCIQYMLSTH